jgi:hypothetical protein
VAAKKTRKSGTRKKTARKRAAAKKRTPALIQLEAELPPTLRDFSRRVRRGLARLEKRIEKDRADARRRGMRMLREASHRLGHFEAQGEREWRRQSLRARRATVQLLRRLERAVEPTPKKKSRKKTTAGKATKRKATPRKTAPRKATPRKATARPVAQPVAQPQPSVQPMPPPPPAIGSST